MDRIVRMVEDGISSLTLPEQTKKKTTDSWFLYQYVFVFSFLSLFVLCESGLSRGKVGSLYIPIPICFHFSRYIIHYRKLIRVMAKWKLGLGVGFFVRYFLYRSTFLLHFPIVIFQEKQKYRNRLGRVNKQ